MTRANGHGPHGSDSNRYYTPPKLTLDEEDEAEQRAYENRGGKPDRASVKSYILREDKVIPRRDWIASGLLLRGCVTAVVAAGAAGKSSFMLALSLHLAAGKSFGRFKIKKRYRVAILSVEEDEDELKRRINAAARLYGFTRADLDRHFFIVRIKGTPTLAKSDKDGNVKPTALIRELEQCLFRETIDVVMIDPLVEVWEGVENDNLQMKAVLVVFRDLARRIGGACLIAHHARKGLVTPGDADAARGGGALVNGARFSFTLTPMTEDEAKELKLPDTETMRRNYARLTSAKVNYVPKAEKGDWFEWHNMQLDNGDDDEAGDFVGVLAPWIREQPRAGADIGKADKAKRVFLDLLRLHLQRDINVSANPQAKNFAPLIFAAHPKSENCGKRAFAEAMEILLDDEAITPATYTAHGKKYTRLEVVKNTK